VRDVAEVDFGYKEAVAVIRQRGSPSIAVNAVRETGANVIETMEGIREAIAELKAGPLKRAGLTLEQVYDETVYIESAIDLVINNIWIGGVLAATILMLFLRSPRATLVVSLAIPVSIVASFVAMAALGRTLNVISLAGIAFAVGMVVDAAIVVLENIYRLRQDGRPVALPPTMRAPGLGGDPRLGADDGAGVPADPGDGARGRAALPRHRGGDLGLGHALAGGRVTCIRPSEPSAQRQGGS
jgi:Cation/multidrug efflux pump